MSTTDDTRQNIAAMHNTKEGFKTHTKKIKKNKKTKKKTIEKKDGEARSLSQSASHDHKDTLQAVPLQLFVSKLSLTTSNYG